MKNSAIPEEILHYTETEAYKRYRAHLVIQALKGIVIVLILAVVSLIAFNVGVLYERNGGFKSMELKIKTTPQFMRIGENKCLQRI